MTDADVLDAKSLHVVERLVQSFHRCLAFDAKRPAASLWAGVEQQEGKRGFFEALRAKNAQKVREYLSCFFASDLIWGLGRFHESFRRAMVQESLGGFYRLLAVDALVSLAQAIGVLPVTSVEHQGAGCYYDELNVNADQVLQSIESALGIELGVPAVGAIYGYRVSGKVITKDMLDHAYTVHRLRQMGESHRIAEIGGGYGCLALLLNRAGYESISVFDLPWVQVLQGYFLLMSLPPGTVSLYGEEDVGAIRLQPYWEFHDLADASIDYVINTNSLPEMAHEDRVGYIDTIRRVAKKAFFSINQESGLRVGDYDPQSSVSGLIAQQGGFRTRSRHRWWMGQGYVEEVFEVQDHPTTP